ncbi:efflux RND transporter periplasmic adaptor subunit [Congregibacter litoralis]|uniref:RND family efflux transporter, MFP subunit n=1 Tax=Congregibacter litoralis KT71 TaxID=314285 RepID=A4AA83_9GAMM|nr:efflux RND transporter periplasmic adaptor subunit [Congregibacter litoralis]EAQ96960.1 RND family efflux transporter, MFP subunit [Congregibacter litoralis KT71]
MKKNLFIATLIGVGLMLWLASGMFAPGPEPTLDTKTAPLADREQALPRVRTRQFNAEQRTLTRILRGKTASKRSATVSAETAGRVIARPVERGDRVEAGTLLCELAIDDREAAVAEAEAALSQAELEYRGALELQDKNLLSKIRIAQVAAELESARAGLARQQLNLARTRITAPFDGVIETLHIDVGDLASIGEPCATLIDLDPLLIEANVSEQDINYVGLGSPVTARTSTDEKLLGEVTFVGSVSDAATRTYPVEITVPNPDYRLRAGLTTVASVETETVLAHRVSPALFTLNDAGVIGLRAVNRDSRVVFHPVTIVEDAADGAWVTGLPGVVRLITVGHEFVSAGQEVETVDESLAPATASLL